jgi:hypothetical protein
VFYDHPGVVLACFRAHLPADKNSHPCPDGWIRADALLADARERGFNVSDDQLHRWRNRGLIPGSPPQFGRKGEGGSYVCYPPETLDLLVAFCQVHAYEKRLGVVGFELWWRGSDFHRPIASRVLARYVGAVFKPLREAIDANPDDPYGVADTVVESVAASDGRDPLYRLLRRRASRNDTALQGALWNLIALLAGGSPGWDYSGEHAGAADKDEPEPEKTLWTILGFGQLEDEQRRLSLQPAMSIETMRAFLEQKQIFDEDWLTSQVTDDARLDRLREPVRQIAEDLPDFSRGACEWQDREDFAGLSTFAIHRTRRDELRWRFAAVVIVVALDALDPNSQLKEFAHAVATEAPKARALLELRDALPQYDIYLHHDWEQRLALLQPDERDKILRDLREFFDKNPRIEAALEGAS